MVDSHADVRAEFHWPQSSNLSHQGPARQHVTHIALQGKSAASLRSSVLICRGNRASGCPGGHHQRTDFNYSKSNFLYKRPIAVTGQLGRRATRKANRKHVRQKRGSQGGSTKRAEAFAPSYRNPSTAKDVVNLRHTFKCTHVRNTEHSNEVRRMDRLSQH